MKFIPVLVAIAIAVPLVADAQTGEKQVVLKGTILCARCALKETKKCQTAIQVKESEKTVTYYFKDKGHDEPYHDAVCGSEGKQGSVTGVVSEKDGKKWIVPSKVEYAKK